MLTAPARFGRFLGAPLAFAVLRRAPLRRFAQAIFAERSVEFETIGQHNDGLRAALAFNHRKPDRLGPVGEQAAAQASGVLDHPMPASIPPDEQAGQAGLSGGSDMLVDHEFSSFAGADPTLSSGGAIA
jgi:hypothetical protein